MFQVEDKDEGLDKLLALSITFTVFSLESGGAFTLCFLGSLSLLTLCAREYRDFFKSLFY